MNDPSRSLVSSRSTWTTLVAALVTATLGAAQGVLHSFPAGVSAGVGDIDKDGHADIAIGRIGGKDVVQVFSGKNGAVVLSVDGPTDDFQMGSAARSAGDVDGDGHADIVVASSYHRDVRLFSGKDGKLIHQWVDNGWFVADVDGGQDIDRDGVPDILVTANQRGAVQAFSGKTGAPIRDFGGYQAARVGRFVGDVDKDGTSDVLVGAPRFSGGYAALFSGKDGTTLFETFADAGSGFGAPVDRIGDLDGDGTSDFLVAAPLERYLADGSGTVRIYSGSTRLLLALIQGERSDQRLGIRASGAGDVDGDGRPDIVVASDDFVRVYSLVSTRAAHASLFDGTVNGTFTTVELWGVAPPVLGKESSLAINAPEYDFAILLQALRPLPRGVGLLLDGWTQILYVDPTSLVNTIPVLLSTSGQATVAIPYPNDHDFLGNNLAYEALVFRVRGKGEIATTNLVIANPGTDAEIGTARITSPFSGKLEPGQNLANAWYFPTSVFTHTGNGVYLTFDVELATSGMGPIEIRTMPGASGGLKLATIPSGKKQRKVRLWVPPGSQQRPTPLYFYNAGTQHAQMSWSLTIG